MNTPIKTLFLTGLCATGLACASTQATPHLVDARRAYSKAESGDANRFVPDQVYTAKVALDEAESAHKRNPGSEKEKHLSYVAHRKAWLAVTQANGSVATDRVTEAKVAYDQLLLAQRNSSRGELDAAQDELEEGESDLAAARRAQAEAEKTTAAALASLEEIASIETQDQRVVITLSGEVLFKTNMATLLPIARDRLDKVAEVLRQQGEDKTISIEGHTDSRGTVDHNAVLSRERAESVRAYLVSRGVAARAITAVGQGETRPIADNSTADGRANNRRVEIVIDDRREKTSQR